MYVYVGYIMAIQIFRGTVISTYVAQKYYNQHHKIIWRFLIVANDLSKRIHEL